MPKKKGTSTDAYERSGALIAAARKRKGLTQTQLAALLGIDDRQVIQHWEKGRALGKWPQMLKLAAALELTLDEIARGERNAPESDLSATARNVAHIFESLSSASQSRIIDRLVALSRFETEDRDIAAYVLTRADEERQQRQQQHEKQMELVQELSRRGIPVTPIADDSRAQP